MPGRIVALLAFFCISFQISAQQNNYLEELIAAAREQKLAQNPEWLKMVHYKKNLFSGYTSEVISKNFFNSPQGMTDPQAELNATLASFFSDKPETDKQQNPQCQFIYRYRWLNEHLHFDPKRLTHRSCPRFQKWIKAINPEQVTLIFPAGTDNSPASMFGHTLFRIDKKGQTDKTRLFSYSINFAANTDEVNGLLFAFKGVFGGYPGAFSVMPYYEKVKQYVDYEHRDIWEYQLNLSKDEIMRLLQHAWELGDVEFGYYFFLENCSYQLLALLDVARPGHDLTDRFSVWAIPADTVSVILEEKGILKKAVFRPSVRTKIRHQASYLSRHEQDVVIDLAYGRIAPDDASVMAIPEKQRALVLITAYDYAHYLYIRSAIPEQGAKARLFSLLRARNKISLPQTIPDVPVPATRFDQGHGTGRLAMGRGWKQDYDGNKLSNFTELRYRPAYHSLQDLLDGYTKGAEINFFDFTLRRYDEDEQVRLQEAMLIDVYSLAPRDKFFKPLSWKIQTGFIRMPIDTGYEDRLVYSVRGGAGLNFGVTDNFNMFAMVDMSLLLSPHLDNDYAAGIGPAAGLLWRVNSFWNIWLSGSVLHYQDSLDMTYVDYSLEQNFAFSKNTALRLSVSEKGDRDNSTREFNAALHWYF